MPICTDCNKKKLSRYPALYEDQTLHPYYDNFSDEKWLYALVNEEPPISLKFYVNPPDAWEDKVRARVHKHFEVFGLAELYASQAANELSNIRGYLLTLRDSKEIKGFLKSLEQSYADKHLNSWQAAFYAAISDSDWFCSEGLNNF